MPENLQPNEEPSKTSPENGNRVIDPLLNEELFSLWMRGKSPGELVDLYRDTDKSFSRSSLYRAIDNFGWYQRRSKIVEEIRKTNQEALQYIEEDKVRTLNMMVQAIYRKIQADCSHFIDNPQHIPTWIPNDAKSMATLMRLHGELT